MKNQINLTKLVDLLADYITAGISINVDSDSEVKTISVSNSRNGNTVKFAFKVMPYGPYCEIIDWQETPEQANTPED
jgi:topoisomerase IA-like protein